MVAPISLRDRSGSSKLTVIGDGVASHNVAVSQIAEAGYIQRCKREYYNLRSHMMSNPGTSNDADLGEKTAAAPTRAARLWPAVALVAIFWTAFVTLGVLDIANMTKFLGRFAAVGALLLLYTIWYLATRTARPLERLAVLGSAILGGVIAMLVLRHPKVVPPAILFYAVPAIITGWTAWLVTTRTSSPRVRRAGMFAIPLVVWAATALVRMEGLSGAGNIEFFWRWSPTGEEQFLAERARLDRGSEKKDLAAAAEPLVATERDWPRFRGPNADSVFHGVKIATNWNEQPPKLAWRRRIGPGWSSITAVGDRLFTQEQRGDLEAVVCFDAATGDEVWAHEDKTRFSEELGGDGPRATPTFADGKIYALGATGILNCLDAATGELKWTQNIAPPLPPEDAVNADAAKADAAKPDRANPDEESAPQRPYWGYSSSPLVTGDVVVVFAGGKRDDSLRAYSIDSGELAWQAASGTHSYSSPQLATFDGEEQVLYLSERDLAAVDPATGQDKWRFEAGFEEGFPSIQPHVVGPSQVLVSFTQDAGTVLLDVTRDGEAWKVEPVWKKRDLKPYFNDFVRYEDSLYGFDGDIFACVDAKTGKRQWKKGRYGAGQVLLLADQGVLLVITEKGEAVLVAADPKEHRELGKFQAIEGKTWNHPTIVGERLFVRNAEEMACYELKLE